MLSLALIVAMANPCDGVVDRTDKCLPPKESGPPVLADTKTAPPPDAFDIAGLPGEMAFLSASLAFGGGAAMVLGLVASPSNDDEEFAQEIAVYAGTGLLVWSGLVGGGALALWAFDPSSGTMRIPIEPGAE